MRPIRTTIPLALLLAAALAGCGDDPAPPVAAPAQAGRLNLVAVDAAAYVLAARLAEPMGDVVCLLPLDECRHRRALRPADLSSLAAADVVMVSESASRELSPSLEAQAPRAVIIRIAFAATADGTKSDQASWAWLDVRRMIAAIAPCRDALKAAAPHHAAAIDARAEALRAELAALDAAGRARFADLPAARRQLLIGDPALATFAAACGLSVTAMPDLTPSRAATTADRDRLLAALQQSGAAAIIANPGRDEALLELLEDASKRGPRLVATDPWPPPSAANPADQYAALLTHWRNLLATALAP